MKNAFSNKHDYHGKTVAIVDDVVTTGSTANSLAQCILDAGAKAVHIWCLAKTH